MRVSKDKSTRRTLKKMRTGHGLFAMIVTLPDNGSYKVLMKMNKGELRTVKIYKDGNKLGKRKEKILLSKI